MRPVINTLASNAIPETIPTNKATAESAKNKKLISIFQRHTLRK